MVPFEMFVLKARIQGYLGDTYEAIDQIYDLIMRSKKVCPRSFCVFPHITHVRVILFIDDANLFARPSFLYSLRRFAKSTMIWWELSSGRTLPASCI